MITSMSDINLKLYRKASGSDEKLGIKQGRASTTVNYEDKSAATSV